MSRSHKAWESRSSTSMWNVWSQVGFKLLSMVLVRTIRPSRTDSCKGQRGTHLEGHHNLKHS